MFISKILKMKLEITIKTINIENEEEKAMSINI
jgi:hypothetical protein